MASKTDICNRALVAIGAKVIQNFDTDTGVEARRCRQLYDPAKDYVLEAHTWDFAEARQALGLISGETIYGYEYGYVYPPDCVLCRELYNSSVNTDPIKFKIMQRTAKNGRMIATDQEGAVLIYTMRVNDINVFSEVFKTALVWKLASDLAIPLTKDIRKQQTTLQAYYAYMNQAVSIDSNEGETFEETESDFLTARN